MTLIDFRPLMGDPVLMLGLVSFFFLLVALPLAFWSLGSEKSSSSVTVLFATANLALAAQLLIRWWESGHFPISNLYESICFLTWSLTLSSLLVERSWPSPLVAAISTPAALLSISFASFVLPDALKQSSPLVPALRSSWLVMHVSVIMCSYAALILGSLLSIGVLIAYKTEKLTLTSSSIGSGFRNNILANNISGKIGSMLLTPVSMNNVEKLDNLSYRTITFGFLLLTVGLISGAVWANEAWGSWWSWDPKETWALICWLVYAAYLHTRLSRGWQGRKSAVIAVIGFFLIIICYLGVNLLGIGLHSYGWFFS